MVAGVALGVDTPHAEILVDLQRLRPQTAAGLVQLFQLQQRRGEHGTLFTHRRKKMIHFADVHVGERLRQRRPLLGLNQMQLAKMIGVSFQQLQKYELGKNRVSASRLWEIAQALRVQVGFFFEGLTGSEVQEWASDLHDFLNNKDMLTLARAFGSISEHHRLSVLNLAKSLAKYSED